MQSIRVAVAEINRQKQEEIEGLLQQAKQSFVVLTDHAPGDNARDKERRLKSREKITLIEDSLARIMRLKPRVLLLSAQYILNANGVFLTKLRRACPETMVILLTDETTEDNQIMKAMANGVRGFINHSTDLINFSKAIIVVEQGEVWVSRKMLGKIMTKILTANNTNAIEVRLDPTC